MIVPEQCQNMTEVRAGVDALDERIVALFAERMRFMDAAARIKPERGLVRDEVRKAAVIAHARETAVRTGFPPDLAESLYEILIEGSIAYEFDVFDRRRTGL